MSDSYSLKVGLVKIEADEEAPVYLTNFDQNLTVAGGLHLSSPELTVDLPDHTGGTGGGEGKLEGLDASSGVLASLAGGYPYNTVKVTVSEATLDDSLAATSLRMLFQGLVYQAVASPGTGRLLLVLKDWKYYMDTVAGVACSEQCFVSYFGDTVCGAVVAEHSVVISTIDGADVTISVVPSVGDFLFNKGYFRLNGTSIKVKYWESGAVFQTSELMPSSWQGQTVTLVAGCDKLIATCRDIHDNEEHFSGWGYSMVDYNPQYEDG